MIRNPVNSQNLSSELPIFMLQGPTGLTHCTRTKGVAYEWYYLELFSGVEHLVLIASLKDPFFDKSPASLYCTWRTGDELEDYGYSKIACCHEIVAQQVASFFEFRTRHLALSLPSHSGCHAIEIQLRWSEHHLPEAQSTHDSLATPAWKHAWQPLAHGAVLQGEIHKCEYFAAQEHLHFSKRASSFFDVPLARHLKVRHDCKSAVFGAESIAYVDHNVGFEPLKELKESWFWWHCHNGQKGEIGYFFPDRKNGYELLSDSTQNRSLDPKVHSPGTWDLQFHLKSSGFGVPYPSGIEKWKVTRLIESAPFYVRAQLVSKDGSPTSGTVESLSPNLIGGKFNQILMAARLSEHSHSLVPVHKTFFKFCAEVTSKCGRSFYFSSYVLPKKARQRAYVTYMLCRLIDDATDDVLVRSRYGGSKTVRALLEILFEKEEPNPVLKRHSQLWSFLEFFLSGSEISPENFVLNLGRFVRVEGWEKWPFEALLDGQEADESFRQPRDLKDFMHYCYLVAGVVGVLMANVFRAPESSRPQAIALGNAMQITNILRDIREDALDLDRVYLPVRFESNSLSEIHPTELKKLLHSLTHPSELVASAVGSAYEETKPQAKLQPTFQTPLQTTLNTIQKLGDNACLLYEEALDGSRRIPSWTSRLCVKVMIGTYGAILGKLRRDPLLSLQQRTVIPFANKLWILVQILFGRSPLKCAGISLKPPQNPLQ